MLFRFLRLQVRLEVFQRSRYPEAFRSAESVPAFVQVLANYKALWLCGGMGIGK